MIDSITLEGGPALDKALTELEARVSRKIVSASLRSGAKVVQRQAQSLSPERTGALRKSIKVKAGRVKRGSGTTSINVGTGKKWFVGDQFYGAFQEFGWRAGKRPSKKSGADNRPQMPGEHFMEYAYDTRAAQAVAVIVADAKQRIDEAVNQVKVP